MGSEASHQVRQIAAACLKIELALMLSQGSAKV